MSPEDIETKVNVTVTSYESGEKNVRGYICRLTALVGGGINCRLDIVVFSNVVVERGEEFQH